MEVNNMNILILGATGMLGHKLMQVLSKKHIVYGTVRRDSRDLANNAIFTSMVILGNIRAENMLSIQEAIEKTRPDVVVNCIGIVKQLPAAHNAYQSIMINALFPHQLADICQKKNIRMIHISTDCVFSGLKGYYREEDNSDADDLYGKTKFLGEVNNISCLTIRTSIIGRELDTSHGLIEWFLSNKQGIVHGYKNAVFSGLTTLALSEIIEEIIEKYPDIHGVYQIASTPITKYDLLVLVKKTYGLEIRIESDESVVNNRSLNPGKFKKETNIKIPSWEYMIDQMYRDPTPYTEIRGDYVQQ